MKPLLEIARDIAEERGIEVLRAVLILAESFSHPSPERKEANNARTT